jgi:hypothetical protein
MKVPSVVVPLAVAVLSSQKPSAKAVQVAVKARFALP